MKLCGKEKNKNYAGIDSCTYLINKILYGINGEYEQIMKLNDIFKRDVKEKYYMDKQIIKLADLKRLQVELQTQLDSIKKILNN